MSSCIRKHDQRWPFCTSRTKERSSRSNPPHACSQHGLSPLYHLSRKSLIIFCKSWLSLAPPPLPPPPPSKFIFKVKKCCETVLVSNSAQQIYFLPIKTPILLNLNQLLAKFAFLSTQNWSKSLTLQLAVPLRIANLIKFYISNT